VITAPGLKGSIHDEDLLYFFRKATYTIRTLIFAEEYSRDIDLIVNVVFKFDMLEKRES